MPIHNPRYHNRNSGLYEELKARRTARASARFDTFARYAIVILTIVAVLGFALCALLHVPIIG